MNSTLTASDVIKIIRECRRQGISEFSLGELKLSFGPKPTPEPEVAPQNPPNPELEKELLQQRELELKQAQLDALRLNDPYAYEQLMCLDQEEEQSLAT